MKEYIALSNIQKRPPILFALIFFLYIEKYPDNDYVYWIGLSLFSVVLGGFIQYLSTNKIIIDKHETNDEKEVNK